MTGKGEPVIDKDLIWTMARLVRMHLVWKMSIESISNKTGMLEESITKLLKRAFTDKIINIRWDTSVIEWMCDHGVGHPILPFLDDPQKGWDIHGCDLVNGKPCCSVLHDE